MARANFLAPLVLALTLVVVAQETFPAEAKTAAQTNSSSYHNNVVGKVEPTTIKIANLSCQELSDLGNAVNKVLLQERKTGDIRKLALVRAQQLAGEAVDVGGLFSGPIGFFRRFLSSVGWVRVKPPENVITLSIESQAAILAIGEVAGQWLKGFVPGGQLGAATVKVLTPAAKLAGKEWATKDIMEEISYFSVTEAGVGTLDVIYDKKTKEAFVNIYLEDLTDEWKAQYGWEDERIYMYIPFDKEPPQIMMTTGKFGYKVVSKAVALTATTAPLSTASLEDKVVELASGQINKTRGTGIFNGFVWADSNLTYCDRFVSAVVSVALGKLIADPKDYHSGYNYAIDDYEAHKDIIRQGSPPKGAIVYYDRADSNKFGGHVGISDGQGNLISVVDTIKGVWPARLGAMQAPILGWIRPSEYYVVAATPTLGPPPAPTEQLNPSMQTHLLFVINPRLQSIKDLEGGLIIGEQTSGPSTWIAWANIALEASEVSARFGSTDPERLLNCLQLGAFDAVLVTKHPWSPLNELIASGKGRFLPWSTEAVEAVTKAFPTELMPSTLPANTYIGQKEVVMGYAPKLGQALPQIVPAPTVQVVDSLGDVGKDTSIAFNKQGNPAISYSDVTNQDLKFAEWDGTSWHIQTVDAAGSVGTASSLAFDPEGNPAIAYYDSGNKNLKYAHWNGATWNMVTVNQAYWSYKNSLDFDASGKPVIAYYDYPACDLKYTYLDGTRWNVESVYRDGLGTGWGRTTSLALGLLDKPAIAFRDPKLGLRYAAWNGSTWAVETIDGGYGTGASASLRFDSLGNPSIAYGWQGSYEGPVKLKFACFVGKSWNMQTVESDGQNPSLSFDFSGNPAVSYYLGTSSDLKYAYWDGSGWKVETVDSVGDVGQSSSLAFDNNGVGVISYYDVTNGDLKVAWLPRSWGSGGR